MKKSQIPEAFLSYLWKFQLINFPLIGTEHQTIIVKKPGIKNADGGPDFSNALIKIDKTTWAGHVEIHNKASDWLKHNHQHNRKYENVILHVVLKDDLGDHYENFKPVAVLELKNKFDFSRYSKYLGFMQNEGWIACENSIEGISKFTKLHFLQRLAIERLERRFISLSTELIQNRSDIEQLFFVQLFKSFGFKTNNTTFELLIKSIPLNVILKHKNNLQQMEALLFGQAGLLNKTFIDEYPRCLKNEYKFLKHKYSLNPIPVHLWQYLRLRPSNFPTIRIAQLAKLLHQKDSIFTQIINTKNTNELLNLFNISASGYWADHYHFDELSKKKIKNIGTKTAESIIINCVLPILFIYGHHTAKTDCSDKAIHFLEMLKGENNHITRKWKQLSFPVDNALQTQALLELKTQYCDFKKCLDCEYGCKLLGK